jgi:hypothetical protein
MGQTCITTRPNLMGYALSDPPILCSTTRLRNVAFKAADFALLLQADRINQENRQDALFSL